MKLYITGSVASGKSTFSRDLSALSGTTCYSLDDVVYERGPSGDRKRTPEERDAIFSFILANDDYIIEDTGRPCFERGMDECDQILLLNPSPLTRRYRIVRRWIRQRLGIEACGYKPTLDMLRNMFMWARNFESGEDDLLERLHKYDSKLVVLQSNRDIKRFLERDIIRFSNTKGRA